MKLWAPLLRVLLLAVAVATLAAAPPDRRPPDRRSLEDPPPAAADRAGLEEVVAEAGVVTTPGAPGWASYLKDLGVAVVLFLARLFEGFNPHLAPAAGSVAVTVAKILLVLAFALLVVFLWRSLRQRVRRVGTAAPSVRELPETDAADAGAGSVEEWAARLENHLAVGDVAAACQALWWWLARSLLRAPVEASWTSRELLSHAGRGDLIASVRVLDRLIYGAAEPGADDVRRLWGELREALSS